MSASNKLAVTAADKAAEITVVDGGLNKVARGIGRLEQALPPGIYEVRVRVGPVREERLVTLDQDREVRFDNLQTFPSPIPLNGTSYSREYHRVAAEQASRTPRTVLGTGATVLVFARAWTADQRGSTDNPATGLSFLDWADKIRVDVAAAADVRTGQRSGGSSIDPSAGWCAEVDPGSYRLRLDLADGTTIERAIHAARGQQTQIFLLQVDLPVSDTKVKWVPDLDDGAVTISPDGWFDPYNRDARLAELGRYALTQKRRFLSDDVLDQLLEKKFADPVLGLVGAHLLLRDKPDDTQLFQVVTDNLLRLLGPDHPDLQALWLRRADRGGVQIRLSSPPMLRSSWDLLVQESFRQPDIFLPGSPASRIAGDVLPAPTWLAWRAGTDDAAKDAVSERLGGLMDTLTNYVGARERAGAERKAKAVSWVRRSADLAMFALRYATGRKQPETVGTPTGRTLTVPEKEELARVLGVPSHVLEERLQKLFH